LAFVVVSVMLAVALVPVENQDWFTQYVAPTPHL
jgi:hypothetical protein